MKFGLGDVIWTNHPRAPDFHFEFEVCIVIGIKRNFYEITMVSSNTPEDRSDTPYSTEFEIGYIDNRFSHAPENLTRLVNLFYG